MPKIGDSFILHPGDGYCECFASPTFLRLAEAAWFKPQIWKWGGDALLFVADEGPLAGGFIALTPRTVGGLSDGLDIDGWKSVIVHKVLNQTETFGSSETDTDACGMSFVETLASFNRREGRV